MMPGEAAVINASTGGLARPSRAVAKHSALLLGGRQVVVDDLGLGLRRVGDFARAAGSAGASGPQSRETRHSRADAGAEDSPPKPFMRCAT